MISPIGDSKSLFFTVLIIFKYLCFVIFTSPNFFCNFDTSQYFISISSSALIVTLIVYATSFIIFSIFTHHFATFCSFSSAYSSSYPSSKFCFFIFFPLRLTISVFSQDTNTSPSSNKQTTHRLSNQN